LTLTLRYVPSIPLQRGFYVFHATLHMIVSLSDYKLVVTVINKSSLPLAAIVQQSELCTLPIRQIMSRWHQSCDDLLSALI